MKRITFLLTIIIIFLWLYKISYQKGLKRWTQSIKLAFIIAVAILGMPPTALAKETGDAEFNHTNTSIEKVQNSVVQRGGFQVGPLNMEALSRQLSPEYLTYQQTSNSPPVSDRFDTINFSHTRFKKLAQDPKAKTVVYHKTSVDEARSALHAEMKGIIENVERIPKPDCNSCDLDFKVTGPVPYTHLDIKHPVGSCILKKQNSPKTVQEMAFDMGEKLAKQKSRFVGVPGGPVEPKNVLHIVDLAYVPSTEKQIVKNSCLNGACSPEGIVFINL